jgi:hypothetical protein
VTGTVDERSIVYLTGSNESDAPQAVILISFDPAIKLTGLKIWKGMHRENIGRFQMIISQGVWANRGNGDEVEACWIWRDQPMYRDIGVGVYLGC